METKPNILLITCHDLGQHVGCYGQKTVRTRHIDRLASEGVRFANSFCVAPQCSPSRAALATGRYPHSNGVMGLTHGYFGWDLHDDEVHLAQALRESGYHTAIAGIKHEARFNDKDRAKQLGFRAELPVGGRDCTALVESAMAYVEERRTQKSPFFLQLGFFEPHRAAVGFGTSPDTAAGVTVPPYLVDTFESREEFAYFQGAVHKVDRAIGQLLGALQRTGQADNTLVIMTTDHGIPFPRAKCSLYDPGLETLLIMRWPAAGWAPGTVHEQMVANIDIMPTVLNLAGVPLPNDPGTEGRSFAPLLSGGDYRPRDDMFAEMTYHDYCDPRRCIRTTTHKLIANFTSAPFFMDPSQSWTPRTITRTPEQPAFAYHEPVELYDLVNDPQETKNLATSEEHAGVCGDLLERLYQWMVASNDPLLEGIPTPPMHKLALKSLQQAYVANLDDL